MALTKCIECGQEISTAAMPSYLHCGYPEPFLTKIEERLKELEKEVSSMDY